MTVYWLLLALPAVLALVGGSPDRTRLSAGLALGVVAFLVYYNGMSLLRHEVGGDWFAYQQIYDDVSTLSLSDALQTTDPAFALVAWLSARFDLGMYPVNFVCSAVLSYGVVRLALTTREPWLAITAAVPYLLIVVGFGYIRQGAAIGCLLVAITGIGGRRTLVPLVWLTLAIMFHATAILTMPIYAFALARRNKAQLIALAFVGVAAFLLLFADRMSQFEAGYLDQDYESGGAMVRLMMSLLPSLLLLLCRNRFDADERSRTIWTSIALVNVAAFVILFFYEASSTAIDRVALYFSPIQVVVFGEILALLRVPRNMQPLIRMLVILTAVMVQLVWLVWATHASGWVPYRSLIEYL